MLVNNVNSSAKLYSNSVAASRYANAAASVRGVQRNDEFTPSAEVQSFSELLNKLKKESDVREDKVRALEQKVSSGQYSVPADQIALSLLMNRY